MVAIFVSEDLVCQEAVSREENNLILEGVKKVLKKERCFIVYSPLYIQATVDTVI